MHSLKSLVVHFGAIFFLLSTLAIAEPVQPQPFQGGLDGLLVNHWESIYDDAAYSLSPLSSLALLTVAGMTMPISTSIALGLGNLALVLASPIKFREEDAVDADGPIWARENAEIDTDGSIWAHGEAAVNTDGPIWAQDGEEADRDGPIWARSNLLKLLSKRQAYTFPGFEGTQIGGDNTNNKRQFNGFEGTQIGTGPSNAGFQGGDNGGAIGFGPRSESDDEKRQTYTFPGFEGTQLNALTEGGIRYGVV